MKVFHAVFGKFTICSYFAVRNDRFLNYSGSFILANKSHIYKNFFSCLKPPKYLSGLPELNDKNERFTPVHNPQWNSPFFNRLTH